MFAFYFQVASISNFSKYRGIFKKRNLFRFLWQILEVLEPGINFEDGSVCSTAWQRRRLKMWLIANICQLWNGWFSFFNYTGAKVITVPWESRSRKGAQPPESLWFVGQLCLISKLSRENAAVNVKKLTKKALPLETRVYPGSCQTTFKTSKLFKINQLPALLFFTRKVIPLYRNKQWTLKLANSSSLYNGRYRLKLIVKIEELSVNWSDKQIKRKIKRRNWRDVARNESDNWKVLLSSLTTQQCEANSWKFSFLQCVSRQ